MTRPPDTLAARLLPWAWGAFVVLHGTLFYLDVWPHARIPFGDDVMYRELAVRGAAGGSATPELLWPPLYSWALVPFVHLGSHWPLFVALVQVLLLAATSVLFRRVVTQATGSEPAGTWAQILLLINPHLGSFAHYLWPEVLYLAEVMALFWLLQVRPGVHAWWIAAGCVAAAIVLTKNVLSPYLPLLLVPLVYDLGWSTALPRVAAMAAVAAALLLPIAARNMRTDGVFTVSDSSLFNLWVGLTAEGRRSATHDGGGTAYLEFRNSGATFGEQQRHVIGRIRARIEEHGVAATLAAQWPRQHFRLFDRRNFLTEQLHGGAFQERGVGYAQPGVWASTALGAWNALTYAFVLVTAALGLCTLPLLARRWMPVLVGLFPYSLAIFFVLEARPRFRLPLMLSLWAVTALLLADPRAARWSPVRTAFGTALAGALLTFAFGADLLP